MVKDTAKDARPKALDVMREIDTSQMDRMKRVSSFFIDALNQDPEAGAKAMEMIQGWAKADRDPERSNPVKTDFWPCLIRGHGAKEFPVGFPAAALTQAGMDHLLEIGAVDKDTFPKDGPAFLENICVGKPTVDGDKVIISTQLKSDVVLLRTRSDSGKTDATWDGDGHVTHVESWETRLGEARRYTPFHLTATYLNWVLIWQKEGLSWPECVRRGAQCLLTGTLYLACEWACRNGSAMRSTSASKKDGYATSILKAWKDNGSVQIPSWMHKWRQKMTYKYIDAVDVGYQTPAGLGLLGWSQRTLEGAIRVNSSAAQKAPEQTNMPFVERDDGPYPLQDAALTTVAPLRFWLCLSACIETTGSLHLDDEEDEIPAFRTYYEGVLSYLGKSPGMLGRKLGKAVVVMYRLILTEVMMAVPEGRLIIGDPTGAPFPGKQKIKHLFDNFALEIIRKNEDMPSASRVQLAEVVAKKIPELEVGLKAIFMKYSGSAAALQAHTFTMFNTRWADVLTHLAAAGSIEGYSRSCTGSLPVSGYLSHMQRLKREGIDAGAERMADEDEERIFHQCFEDMEIPNTTEFYHHLHELSNAKSAGSDRIRFRTNAKTVVGMSDASDKEENHVSNRKDVLHWTAFFMLSLRMLFLIPTILNLFPLGLRSVPARKLRYIYNLALVQQVILRPMYKAMELFMKFDLDGWALAKRTGIPVADTARSINASLDCAHDATLLCLAHDASGLDQHIGPAHRRVWVRVLMAMFGNTPTSVVADFEKVEGVAPSGTSYGGLAANVLTSWDTAKFKTEIVGAPGAVLHVDTQPSGALTTASNNTVVTMAMLRMIERVTGKTQLTREVWGDDCYVIHSMPPGGSAVEVAAEAEELAKTGAGQMLGTVADSTSGRGVHFLQVLYFAGQAIQRRIAYDHEKPQAGGRMPGSVNDLLDKAVKLASRGGNAILLNTLQIITLVEGSHTTQFGRQANVSFDSMAAPGGTTNMVLMGYGQPNSQLFLELMHWFDPDTRIEHAPTLEEPKDIGKRLMAAHRQSRVTVSVGGQDYRKDMSGSEESRYTFEELGQLSTNVLLRPDRVRHFESAQYASDGYKRLDQKGLLEKVYRQSVIRTGSAALGAVLREKRLQPKFKEAALIAKGYIPVRKSLTTPVKKTKPMTKHTGIPLGNFIVTFSFDDSEYVMDLPNAMNAGPGRYNSYEVIGHDNRAACSPFTLLWHPYFSLSDCTRLLLGFTGVQAGKEAMRVSDGVAAFSPDKFRKDMTAKEVMEDLQAVGTSGRQMYLRNVVGFNGNETDGIMHRIEDIKLYRDIDVAVSYSSLADVLKSCSTVRIRELIRHTSPAAYDLMLTMKLDQMNVIITHMISLLYEAINVTCAVGMPDPSSRKRVAIPKIMLTSSSV